MRIAASMVIVLFSTPRFLKTKVVLSVRAHSTNPIARYDDGTHKTAGAACLDGFSIAPGNTMNRDPVIEEAGVGSWPWPWSCIPQSAQVAPASFCAI